MSCNIKRRLSHTYSYGSNEGTGRIKRLHRNAEALAFPAYAHGFRNNNIFQDELTRIGRTDPHLIFLTANRKSRCPLRDDKAGQAADPACFTRIGKDKETVSNPAISNKDLAPVKDIMVAFLDGFRRNTARVGTSVRFSEGKSSQAAVIE